MSLSQVSEGQKVTIVSLNMDETRIYRLTSLGIIPGTRIQVLSNSIMGISLIECKGVRLALGRGLPQYIEVESYTGSK